MLKALCVYLRRFLPVSIVAGVLCSVAHGTELFAIIDSVEQREKSLANVVTRVRVQSWASKPVDVELNRDPLLDQSFEICVRGFRYSIRQHVPANPTQNLPESFKTLLWDGRFWHRAAESGDSRSMLLEDKPMFDASIDCFGLFQESEIISIAGPSLSYVLSKYVLLNQSENAETIRVELAYDTRKTKICTLTFLKTDPVRLQAAVVDLYDAPGYMNGGEHKLQIEFGVEEWGEYSGHVLPKRARRDSLVLATKQRQSRGEKAMRSTAIIERLEASFDSDDPKYDEVFRPHPFAEGFAHLDRTLNVVYTVGQTILNIDGNRFEVGQPLVTPPRRDLPEIMSDAQAIIPENGQVAPQVSLNSAEVSEMPFDRASRMSLFALAGIAGGFMIALVHRHVPSGRRTPRLVRATAVMLACCGLSSAVGWITYDASQNEANTGPLAGEMQYDFGEVINGSNEPLKLNHTFVLRNVTSTDIHVKKVSSSCGCTSAEISQEIVKPDETLEVRTVLELAGVAHRRERIWLNIGDEHPIIELQLAGTSRTTREFYVAEAAIPLKPKAIEELIGVAITDSDTHAPEQPAIVAPNGVQADFKGWKLVYCRHEPTKRPARWQALIEVVQTADCFADDEKLLVTLDGKTEAVELTGRPWR